MDDPHILTWKIIVQKQAFQANANEELKPQYIHRLWDPYYMEIALSALQMSDSTENFKQLCGHLTMQIWWQEEVRQNQLPYIISRDFLMCNIGGSWGAHII